ncbi:MAG: AAA family ATPase [Zoogloeaceae bacterium]|jgi:putative DNA primase/helicase|nr:AAA family ATPase [Zoogloeaceae bacterium]
MSIISENRAALERAKQEVRAFTASSPANGHKGRLSTSSDSGTQIAVPASNRALSAVPAPSPGQDVVILTSTAKIKPEAIDWLWEGWLAKGKAHILAGEAGTGKTTIALSLAAILSRGGLWPDGTGAKPGNIVIWSGEDDPADTIVPRLIAAGADRARIFCVTGVVVKGKRCFFDPASDTDLLREKLVGKPVDLIIVDPIVSAISGDAHKGNDVRRGLQPLVDLGQELGAAILGITHFSKGTQGKNPTDRVTGSVAFAALARIVLVAAKRTDAQEGESTRILCRSKANITQDDGGFGYDLTLVNIGNDIIVSRVAWGERIEGTAREILDAAEGSSDYGEAGHEARDFLIDLLSDGEKPAAEIFAFAKKNGITERTLNRAKKDIRIMSKREGKIWFWHLPASRIKSTLPMFPLTNIGNLEDENTPQTRAVTGFGQDCQSSAENIGNLENPDQKTDWIEVEI